jgi:hypothetical protein
VARTALPSAANDIAIHGGSVRRETQILSGSSVAAAGSTHSTSRARGIGSRFRPATQKTSQVRPTEKFK